MGTDNQARPEHFHRDFGQDALEHCNQGGGVPPKRLLEYLGDLRVTVRMEARQKLNIARTRTTFFNDFPGKRNDEYFHNAAERDLWLRLQ